MTDQALDETRYRTLQYGAVCFGLICLIGAVSVSGIGINAVAHQALLGFLAVLCFGSVALAAFAEQRRDRVLLGRIALGLVALAGLAMAESVAWTFFSPLLDTGRSAFRPTFAFLPLYYLGVVALLRMRVALLLCWVFWGLVLAITVAGLYFRLGMDFSHDGVMGVLTWVAIGNPLVLLLLHALPHYEEQLSQNKFELADLRKRSGLVDQLTDSERRFDLVMDGLQVGVWELWIGSKPRLWCSKRLYELTGYTPEDFTATGPDTYLNVVHADDRQRVWEDSTRQLAQGDILDIEFRFSTRNRGYRWFNSHAKAERDANGQVVRLAGAIEDIHDRRTAEQALHMTQAELTRMAYRDTLTDLHNRRYFEEHFRREWERARRSRQPLTLLLLDLDYFKSYNDRYGHPAGDMCLVEVARLLSRATSRATDILARLGGEEFGIVLPETSTIGAEEVAARIAQLLKAAAIPNEGAPDKVLTLSIGYAVLADPDGPSANELYEQADRALYEVKRRGRNGALQFWGRADLSVVPKEGS